MKATKFSWKARANSFGFAWQGLVALLRTEHNSRIHLVCTGLIMLAGWWLHIKRSEAIVLVVMACLVWMAELFNTAIEKMADLITLDKNPQVKLVKDLSAAAVLVTAAAACTSGAIIFLPKLIYLCKSF